MKKVRLEFGSSEGCNFLTVAVSTRSRIRDILEVIVLENTEVSQDRN